jgi:hypothetical protein
MSAKAAEEFKKALERQMNPAQQSIELDCPPGGIRPSDLIADVIKDTGLPTREPVAKVFGNWTWVYDDIPKEQFDAAKPLLKERITKLYNRGTIRYGSW